MGSINKQDKRSIKTSPSYTELSNYLSSSRIKTNDVNIYDSTYTDTYKLVLSSSNHNNKVQFYLSKEGLQILGLYMRRGISITELCKLIGVTRTTLEKWRRKYPQINQVLSYTRELMIADVESAALRTAKGYTVSLIRPMLVKEPIKQGGKIIGYNERIEYVAYEEHIKPDVNAQRLILNNAYPEVYKADSKQLAEALNQKQLEVVQDIQQGFITKLLSVNAEVLENEEAQVIVHDEPISTDK